VVPVSYLQCLISADRVFAMGASCIPHGGYPSVYKKLLAGKRGVDARGVVAALEADVEVMPPLVDGAPAHRAPRAPAALPLEGMVREPGDISDLEWEQEIEGEGDAEADDPDAVAGWACSAKEGERGVQWGVFRIGPNRRGFQARCPFHRKSLVTECKKYFPVAGPTEMDKRECIRRLLHWCVLAGNHGRQRDHVRSGDDIGEPMTWAELERRKMTRVPEVVLADDVLDGDAAGAAAAAAAPSAASPGDAAHAAAAAAAPSRAFPGDAADAAAAAVAPSRGGRARRSGRVGRGRGPTPRGRGSQPGAAAAAPAAAAAAAASSSCEEYLDISGDSSVSSSED
jgi:pyruvate/2-oxoglutarate dehydrogenase complex dihydrolipoamide acyltransferase (E2) component